MTNSLGRPLTEEFTIEEIRLLVVDRLTMPAADAAVAQANIHAVLELSAVPAGHRAVLSWVVVLELRLR